MQFVHKWHYVILAIHSLSKWHLNLRQNMSKCYKMKEFNPLKTKSILLYLKTQPVPRSKHFSSRL